MRYDIHYTEQYKTVIEADSKDEALHKFQEGEFEPGEYVTGSTEVVGEVQVSDEAPFIINNYAGVDTTLLPTERSVNESGDYVLPALTEWQALNVARNVLHTLIFDNDKAAMSERQKAQPKNSDIRQAMVILDMIQQRMGR